MRRKNKNYTHSCFLAYSFIHTYIHSSIHTYIHTFNFYSLIAFEHFFRNAPHLLENDDFCHLGIEGGREAGNEKSGREKKKVGPMTKHTLAKLT
jgi:hypothetical protein